MSEHEFDAIVIGAGPAGQVCAGRLADAGLEVAIVEQHLVGGECAYYACMPSKALLRPAQLLAEAKRVPGVAADMSSQIDPQAVLDRRDEVIHNLDDSPQLPWLEEHGIELFRGEGKLEGARCVVAGDDKLSARKAVIVATGSGASMPPVEGLDGIRPWNNRDATIAKQVPASMTILGGGPVGSELAQAWSSLGTTTALIEGEGRLLPKEEPFAGEEVAASLRDRFDIDVRTGVKAKRIVKKEVGVLIELSNGDEIEAAELLVAIGRKPHTEDLGLDSIGLEPGESGFLEVNERMRVDGHDWLYAIGDVNGRSLLTHMGKYQAWVAAENVLGGEAQAIAEGPGVPRVTFTDPQVAAVGKTLAQAKEAGIDAKAVDVATDGTPAASFQGKGTGGTCRLVVDEAREVIVGATFTGFETADFLHAATIAMVGEIPLARLRHAVPAYPTRSEIWLKLLEEYGI